MEKTKPVLFINQNMSYGMRALNLIPSNMCVYFPHEGKMRINSVSIESMNNKKYPNLDIKTMDFTIVIVEGNCAEEEFKEEVEKKIKEMKELGYFRSGSNLNPKANIEELEKTILR